MTVYMYIASLAWAALSLGYLLRRRRWLHIPLVLTGIALDVMLVTYLQITREAVQTAMSFTLSISEQIHIANSSIALVLYFPVIFLGVAILRGSQSKGVRIWHKQLASTALVFRTLGFLFMFSLINS